MSVHTFKHYYLFNQIGQFSLCYICSTVNPVFQDQLSLNAGEKYCRMLQREHSAILSTFIKLPVVIKTFVLSIFE